jgi:hypothetical protein
LIATARYELRMMLRRKAMWVSMGAVSALLAVVSARQVADAVRVGDVKAVMMATAFLVNLILPAAYGCLLADRVVRTDRLRVSAVLDATPGPRWRRLVGTYLGACLAAAVPPALLYLGFAGLYAGFSGSPRALGWALAAFGTVLLPAVLFVGAFAIAVPLVLPVPLFCVLFVGYWFWGNAIQPTLLPTLSQTVLTPAGGYPLQGLFGWRGPDGALVLAGPAPGATLNALRPAVTAASAWLSIGLLLAAAALALSVTAGLRGRTR